MSPRIVPLAFAVALISAGCGGQAAPARTAAPMSADPGPARATPPTETSEASEVPGSGPGGPGGSVPLADAAAPTQPDQAAPTSLFVRGAAVTVTTSALASPPIDDAAGPGTTAAVPARPRVAVVGDSLTRSSAEQQRALLTAAGWEVVAIDGLPGAPISARVLTIRSLLAAQPVDALVIALGTNDARLITDTGQDPASAWRVTQASAFTALADARGVPCVVWVGVNANAARFDLHTWGAWFNAWLPRYTTYADWTRTSRDHPDWFLADGVHLTAAGNQQYATLIADTVGARCPVRPASVPG